MSFLWNRHELEYFDHPYNHAALNSRRVEVPIARWFIQRTLPDARILEVGNVLAHYGPVSWPIVDLREAGAINADVMVWEPTEPADLVVSISTIEHIAAPAAAVLARLRGFLAPGGIAVATAPTGESPALDVALREGLLGADQMWFMRVVLDGRWVECTQSEALATSPLACAGQWPGGIMVLEVRR